MRSRFWSLPWSSANADPAGGVVSRSERDGAGDHRPDDRRGATTRAAGVAARGPRTRRSDLDERPFTTTTTKDTSATPPQLASAGPSGVVERDADLAQGNPPSGHRPRSASSTTHTAAMSHGDQMPASNRADERAGGGRIQRAHQHERHDRDAPK